MNRNQNYLVGKFSSPIFFNLVKTFFFLLFFLILSFRVHAQDKFEYHRNILKERCIGGKGKSTFGINLPKLEKVLLTKTTKNIFDKMLPNFVDDGQVGFGYNPKNQDHDIPEYTINYVLLKNGNPTDNFLVRIDNNIDEVIKGITVLGTNNLKTDIMIQSLLKAGYTYRGSISSSKKKYFSDRNRKLEVIITKRQDEGFNFNIFKI